jgi:hypothetical protein
MVGPGLLKVLIKAGWFTKPPITPLSYPATVRGLYLDNIHVIPMTMKENEVTATIAASKPLPDSCAILNLLAYV